MKPLARHVDLVATELGDELIVVDTHRKESHRLSALLAFIYRHADGHTSVVDLTKQARAGLRRAVSKEMVISGLDQLADAGLLAPPPSSASRHIAVPMESECVQS